MESPAITNRKRKAGGKTAFSVSVFVIRWRGWRKVRRCITRSLPPRGAATSNPTPLAVCFVIADFARIRVIAAFVSADGGETPPPKFPHGFRKDFDQKPLPHSILNAFSLNHSFCKIRSKII
jgi:hypothetical protein